MERPVWRAGFEVEVILGDLGDPRFGKEIEYGEPMDVASPAFCRTVAKLLKKITGRAWTAPGENRSKSGFYVISEYGIDPHLWPSDRVAGVELLTPPLPLSDADAVRQEIIKAIYEIDDDFNFLPSEVMKDCGWHINIDAGDKHGLSPDVYIVGTDELLLLSRNSRLFGPYTGLQRHTAGLAVLRHLRRDPQGTLLRTTGLTNILNKEGGYDKSYAANFAKLERGYVELRHFSAFSFFNGPSLIEQLDRILAAMEIWPNQDGELKDIFLRKLLLLFDWLESIRAKLTWEAHPLQVIGEGKVLFDGEPLGRLMVNGLTELYLNGHRPYEPIASIREILLPDVAEAVALLALDLSELRNLGIRWQSSPNKSFQKAVLRLAARLRADSTFSSDYQLSIVRKAEEERQLSRQLIKPGNITR